jgi:gluconate 5-dehydrogenase
MMEYKNLFQVENQTAVVAGGYGGIGTELCKALAYFGSNIVIVGRDGKKAEKLANEIVASGRKALGLQCNATCASDVNRLVQISVGCYGRIDILVNCIGTHKDAPAEEYREEDWDNVVNGNLKATFLLNQAVGKVMIRQKKGKIINFSSVRSQLGIQRGYLAYCSSKGGINMLTKQLASEWAKYNINVNAIAPTFIRTEQVAQYLNDKEFYERLITRVPLGRVGETFDLVGAVLFLASPASDFITGQILFVDGGITACQ